MNEADQRSRATARAGCPTASPPWSRCALASASTRGRRSKQRRARRGPSRRSAARSGPSTACPRPPTPLWRRSRSRRSCAARSSRFSSASLASMSGAQPLEPPLLLVGLSAVSLRSLVEGLLDHRQRRVIGLEKRFVRR